MLASGEETGFRINVDGRKGDHFQDVRIQANDSLYVFVEVTVNPNASNQPLLVDDSVIFTTNGIKQSVRLEAYGQNVNLYKNGLIPDTGPRILQPNAPTLYMTAWLFLQISRSTSIRA